MTKDLGIPFSFGGGAKGVSSSLHIC